MTDCEPSIHPKAITRTMRLVLGISLLAMALATGSLSCVGRVSAFVMVTSSSPVRLPKVRHELMKRCAIIYGWDDPDENTEGTAYNNDYATVESAYSYRDSTHTSPSPSLSQFESESEEINNVIAQHINHDRVGSLSRLAVAFASPDHPLDMSHLDHVDVVEVDEHHIDIEAVVCDQSECASLLVPVSFPHDCAATDDAATMEACVLENIEELDNRARTTIDKVESEQDELHLPVVDYPGWWVSSLEVGSRELVVEVNTIKELLNTDDEFAIDVRNLACMGLGFDLQQNYLISKAVVADVGPAGLCLKALTAVAGTSTLGRGRTILDDGTSVNHHVVDVSLPFGGEPRMDAASLRLAVLSAVDAAHVE